MTQTTTLAQAYQTLGKQPPGNKFICTATNIVTGKVCGHKGWAFEFADVSDVTLTDRAFVCGGCYQDILRVAETVGRLMQALVGPAPDWDSEEGWAVKVKRNEKVREALWAAGAGSPLTEANQAEWAAYIAAWHRVTLDFAGPREAVAAGLPVEPAKVYA